MKINNVDIHTGATLADTVKADSTMALVAFPGNQTTLLEKAPDRPSNDLMAYIATNTGGAASRYVLTLAPTYTSTQSLPPAPAGTQRVTTIVDGATYYPLVAPCPAASCTNGDPIANAIADPGTSAYNEAVARKTEKDINIITAAGGVFSAAARGVNALTELATASGGAARVAEALGANTSVNVNAATSTNAPQVIAKVNAGRSPYSEITGAIGEFQGYENATNGLGHVGIQAPGKTSVPGRPDYLTFDTAGDGTIYVWDAKYRAPNNASYPKSIPTAKLDKWMPQVENSVNNMPPGPLKDMALDALINGRVTGKVFKWPQ